MAGKKWHHKAVQKLYEMGFLKLIAKAQAVHRKYFDPNEVELCTLLNIKTGACPEDCAYCPQSGHYKTGLQKESLWDAEEILEKAKRAKENGAVRFCMGAAWRSPPEKDFHKVVEVVKAVKAMGLETCVTLGLLEQKHAQQLKEAGLDFYNHNLDSSPEFYKKIITTRTYEDRLKTLQHVREADIHVCCGGIIGMGESREDRIGLLCQLANLPHHPESVPINRLIPIKNTPLEKAKPLDNLEFIRTVAIARIMMPKSKVRLSAGRESMSEEMQALCFMAGANSIHFGEKLLVTSNPDMDQDRQLLARLGLNARSIATSDCTEA